MSHRRNLLRISLRLATVAAVIGLGACQSLEAADQRAFVAAHVVRFGGAAPDGVITLGQDAAYARLDAPTRTEVALNDAP